MAARASLFGLFRQEITTMSREKAFKILRSSKFGSFGMKAVNFIDHLS